MEKEIPTVDWNNIEFNNENEIRIEYDVLQWKPSEPGESIIGQYLKSQQGTGNGADLLFHHIIDQDQQEVSILGCIVLNRKIESIEPGTPIKIIYKGQAKGKKGRTYKDFAVIEGNRKE